METNTNKSLCNSLIEKLSKNRDGLEDTLETITHIRKRINLLLPVDNSEEKSNFRNKGYQKFIEQENMKYTTEVIKTELEVRRAIENSIKNEIDLRKKLDPSSFEDKESEEAGTDSLNEFLSKIKGGDITNLGDLLDKIPTK
jgi:hypothetical protein